MEFTQHAINKLDIYSIDMKSLTEAFNSPIREFYDNEEHSLIKIIIINDILFACVFSIETNRMITIYRTDNNTIINRRNSKRWT